MKKLKIFSTAMILFVFHFTEAQNINKQYKTIPLVDPLSNCELRYYYFPNIEAYYDTKENIYYFKEKGNWIKAEEIPSGYKGYSIYNKMNVIINDYDDDNPYLLIKLHKKKYPYCKNGKLNNLTANN